MDATTIKEEVRKRYGQIAEGTSCCSSCCGGETSAETIGRAIGYSGEDLQAVPDGANLGLGCGNPVALAALKPGETVIDLGSGAGFDCFLAAQRVGESGSVIGIDMTPEMLAKAQANAEKGGYTNVEFRRGEIDALPVADTTADAIISNCVINLAPDKAKVFAEAFRVLKSGGRLMVSDIVLLRPLPAVIADSVAAYVGCLAGAMLRDDYLGAIRGAGFEEVEVVSEAAFPIELFANDPTFQEALSELKDIPQETLIAAAQSVVSMKVQALRP